MAVTYTVVDLAHAQNEDAAELEITPQLRLNALDAIAPEDGSQATSVVAFGRHEDLAAPEAVDESTGQAPADRQ